MNELGSSIAPWAAIIALLASIVMPAIQFKVLREIDTKFAPLDSFKELKTIVSGMDYTARTEFDQEILRINNRTSEDIREVRGMIQSIDTKDEERTKELRASVEELRKTISSMRETQLGIIHDLELHKKDVEYALKIRSILDEKRSHGERKQGT